MSKQTEGVPYLDLVSDFQSLRDDWIAAIDRLGSKAAFILGDAVTQFQQEACDYIGCKHALGVANGTDALVLSLRALGIGPGDEVITSPFTFFATAEAISLVGATPVFADINEFSFNISPASVKAVITDNTRAILPVHIFGHPANMAELRAVADAHGLKLIEDAAQAFGAKSGDGIVGSLGDTGCFSFYPAKVLGCYGDGGLVTTSDEGVYEHLQRLRNHGAVAAFTHTEIGYNSRLDAVQAALLSIKLKKIEEDIEKRRQVASWYDEALEETDAMPPARPDHGRHAFNLYTIRHPRRNALRQALGDANIGTNQCYPQGLHLQQVYHHLGYKPGDLPVTDQLCTETLSLPIFPGMSREQVERVCEVIRKV
ncbi:MAG: DegT/DnrJ/EryC1/StrS family aminotransferase [Gammaproteobacteria bacterium]|jgi:dTDP-4-amino-4,6-dideoxygalactose transaminase